jgi:hypothetical protein
VKQRRWSVGGLVVLVLAAGAVPARAAAVFRVANIAAGDGPVSVAVGDFNRDGIADLAVANTNSVFEDDVSVLLGAGDGTFGVLTNYPTGESATSVVVGDFNRDGNTDLAVANFFSSDVSVLLGNGDGSFGAAANFPTSDLPRALALEDFNRDGNLDLAVANGSSVSVLLGAGDGTFAAPTDIPVARPDRPATSVAVGDFNGDGNPDLAVAIEEGIAVLLGAGNGTFGPASNLTTGGSPASVAVGDFNSDGKPDLAAGNCCTGDVAVFLGTGNGTFGPATNFPVGDFPASLVVADFNGDGNADLASANSDGGDVSVLLGAGNGTFGVATHFDVGGNPVSVAVGDFNGDGRPDLAITNFVDVAILLNARTRALRLSPGALAFGPQPVGTLSAPKTVTLTNTGSFGVSVSHVRVVGAGEAEYPIVDDGCSGTVVPEGGSCSVSVRFAPSVTGARAGVLEITTDAPRSPHTVALRGVGRRP